MRNIEEPSHNIFCYVCERDVTNITHPLDEVAKVHVCLPCFASGKEKKDFKRGQPYRIIHKINFDAFTRGWTAHEELLLFEGLQQSGFGNWVDISKLVVTKTKDQCELHYIYVDAIISCQFWLKHNDKLAQAMTQLNSKGEGTKLDLKTVKNVMNELKIKPAGELGDEERTLIEQKYARYKDKIERARTTAKPDSAFNDILGFMPLRRDFDYEYDNEAELFLAEMEFGGRIAEPKSRRRPAR
jgi:transcriptional adapter 2-alpha